MNAYQPPVLNETSLKKFPTEADVQKLVDETGDWRYRFLITQEYIRFHYKHEQANRRKGLTEAHKAAIDEWNAEIKDKNSDLVILQQTHGRIGDERDQYYTTFIIRWATRDQTLIHTRWVDGEWRFYQQVKTFKRDRPEKPKKPDLYFEMDLKPKR